MEKFGINYSVSNDAMSLSENYVNTAPGSFGSSVPLLVASSCANDGKIGRFAQRVRGGGELFAPGIDVTRANVFFRFGAQIFSNISFCEWRWLAEELRRRINYGHRYCCWSHRKALRILRFASKYLACSCNRFHNQWSEPRNEIRYKSSLELGRSSA